VVFNPLIPLDLLFAYDLPASYPCILHGVHDTNRISVRLPSRYMNKAEFVSETVETIDRKVHIRLLDDVKVGFAHFHPARENNMHLLNFGVMVTDPRAIGRFLHDEQSDHITELGTLDGQTLASGADAPAVSFDISPLLQIHVQLLSPEMQQNCATVDESGNCVKLQGDFGRVENENAVRFQVTEVFQIPYCRRP
jgi:hypothetical protein